MTILGELLGSASPWTTRINCLPDCSALLWRLESQHKIWLVVWLFNKSWFSFRKLKLGFRISFNDFDTLLQIRITSINSQQSQPCLQRKPRKRPTNWCAVRVNHFVRDLNVDQCSIITNEPLACLKNSRRLSRGRRIFGSTSLRSGKPWWRRWRRCRLRWCRRLPAR